MESVANAAKKGRSDRKEVDRGGFFSERTDKVRDRDHSAYGIDRAAWHGVTRW
jgi:hypothetical protein